MEFTSETVCARAARRAHSGLIGTGGACWAVSTSAHSRSGVFSNGAGHGGCGARARDAGWACGASGRTSQEGVLSGGARLG